MCSRPGPRGRGAAAVAPALLLVPALLMAALLPAPVVASAGNDAAPPAASVDETAPVRQALPRPPDTPCPSRATVRSLIDRYATRYGLERDLVHALVRAESAYNAHAVSPAGAIGVMQVMPETAASYGVRPAAALFDAETNVRVGTRHLKKLVSRYGIGKAVMAYNAGEGALKRQGGFVSYPETQRYTHAVLSNYLRSKGIATYSAEARAVTGITLTPAMASAGGGAGAGFGRRRPLTPREQARRMRRVDLSTLSLKIRPSLTDRALDPSALDAGPESKPMFVLERPGGIKAD
ncbi:MAG: lytic transglycosylase domain-containing protein [Thiohalocapsa sp.]|jgi:hypothetical protein|uniref:lytic transglycosylase domain-containing protein n=1 Tax=Thiohalocapsa sp. TaxID=2497641 RepID=UPI0025F48860|nr:lytic transglycosylase domain-containing protein [Thiohalocapsa sp.]MCG6943055.1 lytic transglycosylase domain-containing protein [Thiohalocapsa sp.]